MSNKEYAQKLHKSYRQDRDNLIKLKPNLRNFSFENYQIALKNWQIKYNEIDCIMNTIVIDFNNGVEFLQILDL